MITTPPSGDCKNWVRSWELLWQVLKVKWSGSFLGTFARSTIMKKFLSFPIRFHTWRALNRKWCMTILSIMRLRCLEVCPKMLGTAL
jgi:hypothetical protein